MSIQSLKLFILTMEKFKKKTLRIIFAGTTNFSAYYLHELIHSPHQIIAILTQPYFPKNYEKLIYVNSVQEIAKKYQIPILQPNSLYTNEIVKIINYINPDIIIVISYGLIIPQKILKLPLLGCINVHGSLLPRWRGAAPIQRAIEAGDTQSGISIIQMDSGIDTGNILHQISCNILPHDTSLSIFKKLTHIGINALLQTLEQIIEGNYNVSPQNNSLSTYAKKITKNEGAINWNIPTIQLERKIRAFNPWPVNYFKIKGKRIKIWKAKIHNIENTKKNIKAGTILSTQKSKLIVATNDGSLSLISVQEEGKKIISINELLSSKKHWFIPGSIL